jgi:hypothetical protein
MAGMIENLGAVEKRFGRDAAFVQANSSNFIFLDQENGKTRSACSFSGHISAGATAQYK